MFTKKPDGSGLTNDARPVLLAPSNIPQTPSSFPPTRGSAGMNDGAPFVTSGRVLANGAAKTSVIAADLTVTGKLVAQGEVVVEGTVQGDVDAVRAIIGPNATVTGNVIADGVDIMGAVFGSVRGGHVVLRASSRVEGDVFHQSLSIEQGAHFEGRSTRSEAPKSAT